MIEISDNDLKGMLRECSPWPWQIRLTNEGKWEMVSLSKSAKVICEDVPESGNNVDKRLWMLAPVLAAELYSLRKENLRLRNKS